MRQAVALGAAQIHPVRALYHGFPQVDEGLFRCRAETGAQLGRFFLAAGQRRDERAARAPDVEVHEVPVPEQEAKVPRPAAEPAGGTARDLVAQGLGESGERAAGRVDQALDLAQGVAVTPQPGAGDELAQVTASRSASSIAASTSTGDTSSAMERRCDSASRR